MRKPFVPVLPKQQYACPCCRLDRMHEVTYVRGSLKIMSIKQFCKCVIPDSVKQELAEEAILQRA